MQVTGLSKSFGGLQALQNISFSLPAGQVTALVGDNGAGKSSLVKCLSGIHLPDEGEIAVKGQPVTIRNPAAAERCGIETVYQDLALIDHSNVTQNLFLNREIRTNTPVLRSLGWLDHKAMNRRTTEILQELGIKVPTVKTRMRDLSGGQRQCVAIGRAVGWSQQIVFLDEPTASLGVQQTALVLSLVRRLADRGIAVMIITHNMEHVMQVCDRVLVLRLGRLVADRAVNDVDGNALVEYITGLRSDARSTAVQAGGSNA